MNPLNLYNILYTLVQKLNNSYTQLQLTTLLQSKPNQNLTSTIGVSLTEPKVRPTPTKCQEQRPHGEAEMTVRPAVVESEQKRS